MAAGFISAYARERNKAVDIVPDKHVVAHFRPDREVFRLIRVVLAAADRVDRTARRAVLNHDIRSKREFVADIAKIHIRESMYEYVRTILVNLPCHGVDKIVIRPRKTNARSLFATFFAGAEVFVVALTYRNDIAVGVTFEKFFNLFRNGVRGFVAGHAYLSHTVGHALAVHERKVLGVGFDIRREQKFAGERVRGSTGKFPAAARRFGKTTLISKTRIQPVFKAPLLVRSVNRQHVAE